MWFIMIVLGHCARLSNSIEPVVLVMMIDAVQSPYLLTPTNSKYGLYD